MPSEEKCELIKSISPTLKSQGFKKRNATWYRVHNGFIQVFNIQGSQWSKSFYLNLGIYIVALGTERTPPEYDCHIRSRVDDIVNDRLRYHELLNLENEIPSRERYEELIRIIKESVIPWLSEFSDKKCIVDFLMGKKPHTMLIHKTVYDFYGVKPPA